MINNGKYRFYIFWIDNGGWYIIKEIKPVNTNDLNIVYTNKYKQRFLTRDLSGEVKLINDASNNIFDFDLIRNIEKGVAGYPDSVQIFILVLIKIVAVGISTHRLKFTIIKQE